MAYLGYSQDTIVDIMYSESFKKWERKGNSLSNVDIYIGEQLRELFSRSSLIRLLSRDDILYFIQEGMIPFHYQTIFPFIQLTYSEFIRLVDPDDYYLIDIYSILYLTNDLGQTTDEYIQTVSKLGITILKEHKRHERIVFKQVVQLNKQYLLADKERVTIFTHVLHNLINSEFINSKDKEFILIYGNVITNYKTCGYLGIKLLRSQYDTYKLLLSELEAINCPVDTDFEHVDDCFYTLETEQFLLNNPNLLKEFVDLTCAYTSYSHANFNNTEKQAYATTYNIPKIIQIELFGEMRKL